jgi:hypothetical protein
VAERALHAQGGSRPRPEKLPNAKGTRGTLKGNKPAFQAVRLPGKLDVPLRCVVA